MPCSLEHLEPTNGKYSLILGTAGKILWWDGQPRMFISLLCVMNVITSAEEGGYVFGAVCLSVCPSDYSQTCERILTKFFVGVGHGSRTKWYNFGGDPDYASDAGVQSPKSRSSILLTNCVMPCLAEVCAVWAYSHCHYFTLWIKRSSCMHNVITDNCKKMRPEYQPTTVRMSVLKAVLEMTTTRLHTSWKTSMPLMHSCRLQQWRRDPPWPTQFCFYQSSVWHYVWG